MKTRRSLRRIIGLSAVATAVAAGGTAFAFWSAGGTGIGAASAGTLQTVTIVALAGGDSSTGQLIPGGTADVIVKVNNPNTFPVTTFSITSSGTITADSGHAGCTTTGVTFNGPVTTAVSLPTGQTLLHLTGAASMSAASMSACQGAKFSIPLTLVVRR